MIIGTIPTGFVCTAFFFISIVFHCSVKAEDKAITRQQIDHFISDSMIILNVTKEAKKAVSSEIEGLSKGEDKDAKLKDLKEINEYENFLINQIDEFRLKRHNHSSSLSISPKIFINNLTPSDKKTYYLGALETAIAIYKTQNNEVKINCIKNWFVGNAKKASQEFVDAVSQVKDKEFPVAAVILILIDRHCGKLKTE